MKTSVVGFPRIGALRELKFASEKYFRKEISLQELEACGADLRARHINEQSAAGIDFIPCNDFSFYDGVLDTAVLLNAVPARYRDLNLPPLDIYFAMARGYQGEAGDVKALAMKKWFNTNYHYIVPEIEDDTEIKLAATKPFEEFAEAKSLLEKNGGKGCAKPVLTGPFTFLKLARFTGGKNISDFADDVTSVFIQVVSRLEKDGALWIQFDEPALVMDLTAGDKELFCSIYRKILGAKGGSKILLQTYFGDVRDCYGEIRSLGFDGIGLDFVEGKKSLGLVSGGENFPPETVLFAGLVNGKNIWRNDYSKTIDIIERLCKKAENIVIGTSCSLLHVPYTLENEKKMEDGYRKYFAFASEKLKELSELRSICQSDNPRLQEFYTANKSLFDSPRPGLDEAVRNRCASIKKEDFTRLPEFEVREKIQKQRFNLPLLPTTTIGSFPQTPDVKANRAAFRKGEISENQYVSFNRKKIADCIAFQEKTGLDVLVHGEYERNDMVEYFGECLDGYIFTERAWVQSYGTRCVKPPVVWGDVSRAKPMTVVWSQYAKSLTAKPVKGMLTGPVTILNWSFPREDIALKDCVMQIALAIRDEVLDLEAAGISVIQIDEAALREKLPLRKSDWQEDYLSWAIPAFRLVHSGVKPETQIHTHMCYSEFTDIIPAIDDMDADVITFEASRSDLQILDALKANNFKTEVGPGVYDIHSPRVPSVEEIAAALRKMLEKIPEGKLWVNPDCGLKTRGTPETEASLKNLVAAARLVRGELK